MKTIPLNGISRRLRLLNQAFFMGSLFLNYKQPNMKQHFSDPKTGQANGQPAEAGASTEEVIVEGSISDVDDGGEIFSDEQD